jgi:alpha-tubulin suppressor-like RCC1 family protein
MAIVVYPPMKGGGWVYTWGSGYTGQLGRGDILYRYAYTCHDVLI